MNFLKSSFYIALILLSSFCTFNASAWASSRELPAQGKGNVTGSVHASGTNQFIEYATVSLFQLADSALVTGTITGGDGAFSLQEVPFGEYFLQIKFLGFKTATMQNVVLSKEQPIHALGKVALEATTEQLEGIEIAEDRKSVV